jgi:vancomycin resistance protein YoaR
MKRYVTCAIVCGAFVALSQTIADAAEQTETKPITRHEAELTTLTATVESVDLEKREVTLKGPRGNKVTLEADKSVKRLDEIKPGDLVRASYYQSVAAELREPTAEEKANPLVVEEGAAKAPHTQAPGLGVARRATAVATIESIDRSAQTITVKGPRGRTVTAKVEHPENLEKMQVGQNIVITYTEALALSLEKVGKKSAE